MSVKHTPGPWVAVGYWVEHLGMQSAEIEANARLIAAAPDTLEALQSLVRAVEQFTSAVALGWPELEQAKEAITKATGEQA